MGEISNAVRDACTGYRSGKIDRGQLIEKLRFIILKYKDSPGNIYLNVGLAFIIKWGKKRCKLDHNEIMEIVDEVDPQIRPVYERWV